MRAMTGKGKLAEATINFVIVFDGRRRGRGEGEVAELKSHHCHYSQLIIEIN